MTTKTPTIEWTTIEYFDKFKGTTEVTGHMAEGHGYRVYMGYSGGTGRPFTASIQIEGRQTSRRSYGSIESAKAGVAKVIAKAGL